MRCIKFADWLLMPHSEKPLIPTVLFTLGHVQSRGMSSFKESIKCKLQHTSLKFHKGASGGGIINFELPPAKKKIIFVVTDLLKNG